MATCWGRRSVLALSPHEEEPEERGRWSGSRPGSHGGAGEELGLQPEPRLWGGRRSGPVRVSSGRRAQALCAACAPGHVSVRSPRRPCPVTHPPLSPHAPVHRVPGLPRPTQPRRSRPGRRPGTPRCSPQPSHPPAPVAAPGPAEVLRAPGARAARAPGRRVVSPPALCPLGSRSSRSPPPSALGFSSNA